MESILQDLKFSLRSLRKEKGFAATAIATLAVCIGANAAIFSIIYAVVLQPLPVPEPDQILAIHNSYPGAGAQRSSNGVPDYYDRLRDVTACEELALYNTTRLAVGERGIVEQVRAMNVTPSLFRVLRARPLQGRMFSEEEGTPGKEQKVILSYSLWQKLFAGQAAVIGRDLRVSGRPYTVVGVMPKTFVFMSPEIQLWRPLAFTAEEKSDSARHSNSYEMIGRLKPGATLQQAQAQVNAINAANLDRFPELKPVLVNAGFSTYVVPLQDDMIREVKKTLMLLWGGALFVLLIGVVNIANIVLARSSARVREIATRFALGAGRLRVVRQLITESLVLTLLGAASGLILGYWGLMALNQIGLDRVPRADEVALNGTVVLFIMALSLLVGVAIGLIPMVHTVRVNLSLVFRQDTRAGGGRGARLLRNALAVAQVGVALILLVASGLLLESFRKVIAIDPGFGTPRQLLTGSISLPSVRYPNDADRLTFMARLLEGARNLPGVQGAGATDTIPFGSRNSDSVILAEGYEMKPGESLVSPNQIVITPGYFEAMGITLLQGRRFDERDTEKSARVIIVDDRLARRFWRDQSPVGKRMWRPSSPQNLIHPDETTLWYTVVGVVRSVKVRALVDPDERVGAYFYPYTQAPISTMTLALKSSRDPSFLIPVLRNRISELDPELPLYDVRTMQQRAEESLVSRKSPMVLSMVFGAVALFLAGLGIYGVLAYMVAQRTKEIGIRVAVGSSPTAVFHLILGEGAAILTIGLVLGLSGTLALGKYIRSQLYSIQPMEPSVLLSAAALLAFAALVACVLPARRATRIDPIMALRCE